jgi:hypothetical protein
MIYSTRKSAIIVLVASLRMNDGKYTRTRHSNHMKEDMATYLFLA